MKDRLKIEPQIKVSISYHITYTHAHDLNEN